MRVRLALITLSVVTAGLSAQTLNDQNHTQIWDQTTEFTSRGSNGGNPGHVGQAFQYGFGMQRNMTRAQYAMQDQNLATQEIWNVGTNGIAANGDADFPNLNAYATNLTLPVGTGIGAFLVTHNPLRATPHPVPATLSRTFHTWNLPVQTNWTTDGLSVHMSQAAPYRATRICTGGAHREIPRSDGSPAAQIIEQLSWTGVANNPRPTWNDRTWRHVLSFEECVLKGFSGNTIWNASPCPNPNPGYASIDPNVNDLNGQTPPRTDDLVWDIRSGPGYSGGFAVLFLTTTVFPNGGLPTPFGTLHVDLSTLFLQLNITGLDANGIGRFTLPLSGFGQAIQDIVADFGCVHAQAVAVNTSTLALELSSLWSMRTKNLPTGWTAATAFGTTTGCKDIAHNATPGLFAIRNDGIGEVTVQMQRSGQNIGPAVTVGERSCVNIPIPAGANNIKVCSPSNSDSARPTDFIHRGNM